MIIRRLLYGFLSQSTDPINLVVPWQNSAQDGMFQMNYSLEKSVETNLRVWAKTNRGDRPMRFDFGLDAYRMLFEPEPIVKEVLSSRARQQLSKYFGFLTVTRLEVITSSESAELTDHAVRFVLEGYIKDDESKRIKILEDIGV